jgi:hypothetical protein
MRGRDRSLAIIACRFGEGVPTGLNRFGRPGELTDNETPQAHQGGRAVPPSPGAG